jgi:hypothetical protein
MKEIKKKIINIVDLKKSFTNNLGTTLPTAIICELYRLFGELSIEYFNDNINKRELCYDQLCICLDSINDNMCDIMLMKKLTCTIYESGLCNIEYD